MPGAAIGALLGWAFSGALAGAGIFSIFGIGIGTLWLVGASIGSLFDAPSLDIGGSTPNYAFGQLSNTKSQLLPVPIVYGRCRMGGNIFMQTFYDDSLQKMDIFVGVSEGPIQSIKSVYANDLVLIDENGDVVHELAESSLNLHLGEPDQVADSRDPGANAYPNTAYIALTLKAQDGLSGNPVISSIVEGCKVWTPSGTVFSRNPAWIVYDFLTNTRYGVGIPTEYIDLDSFTAAATYCDHPIDGEPRFTLDYIIDVQRPAVDHLQAMLGCFRGFFLARDKIELHVEQAGSVYKALGPDNFVKGSFTWWQKSGDDSPNRIVIEWIDPNNHYEQSSAPFEIQEDIQARGVYEKSISLLGVTRPEQVGRLGNYLLETARRVQNFCAFQVSLQDADIEAGEIISITYPDFTGWSAKPFRVLAVQDEGQTGTVTITCAEYDAAVYSDDGLPVDTPTIEIPPVTYDDVYALTLEDVGHQEGDGTWVTIIRASWQNPSDYTPTAINVRWRYVADEGEPEEEWTLHVNSTRLITQTNISSLETWREVEVWVNCVRPDTVKETTGKIASIIVGRDVEAPDAPTGLTATGWFGSIILNWINPTAPDLNYVELWENAVDDRSGAVKIAEVKGAGFTRYLGSFQGRYYWVRGVDLSGNIGPWNADAGVYGNSDQETHQDFVDLLLKDNPYLQEAIGDLNTRIDPIDFALAEIKEISLPDLEDMLLNISEVDLPGAVQRLAERVREIDSDVMDQLNFVSSSAVDALLNIAEVGQRITDAGIEVDPETGEVKIWAIDQMRTEYGVRISNAESLISAAESKISDKVWLADVDDRIAEAVFGDVGELLVSGLQAQINTVEQELDAAKAELTQKATAIEVNALGGRVGTAEVVISGMEAAIDLKAAQIEVNEIGTRVSTAESRIDALDGSITQEIVAIEGRGIDLAELTAEGLVQGILNDSDKYDRSKIQLATAKTELYARVEDGILAEAGQRTALAAVVNGNTSLIYSEALTRATEDSALARQITTLGVDVGKNKAAIQNEATTRADAISAEATARQVLGATTLTGTVTSSASAPSNPTNGQVYYNTTSKKYFYWNGSSWVEVKGVGGSNRAAIQTEITARTDADSALTSQVTTLTASTIGGNVTESATAPAVAGIGDVYFNTTSKKYFRWNGSSWVEVKGLAGHSRAAIQTEITARTDADSAFTEQITTLTTNVDKNYAEFQDEITSRTDADGALSSRITTLAAYTIDGTVTESATAPANPTVGQVYFNTTSKKYFRWNGTAWVEVKGPMGHSMAAIQTETIARISEDGAIASQVTTLETSTVGGAVTESSSPPANPTVGKVYFNTTSKKYFRWNGSSWVEVKGIEGHSRAAIQIVNESVDGIKAKHGVRIDVNGYVTGYELIGTGSGGSMIFHVDNFLIGRPGTTSDYPFALGTVDGVTRLSLKNAWIEDGAIKNAKIQDLTVGRIKLASGGPGALTWGVTSGYQWPFGGPYGFVNTSENTYENLYIDTTGATHVLVQAYMRSFIYGGNVLYGKLTKNNGSQALGAGGTAWLQSESHMIVNYMDTNPGTGTQSYQIKGWVPSGSGEVVAAAGIMAIAFYR